MADYYGHLYGSKMGNLEEIDKCLENTTCQEEPEKHESMDRLNHKYWN